MNQKKAHDEADPTAMPAPLSFESAIRYAGHALFGALAALSLLFCVLVCEGVLERVGRPFVGFTMTAEGFVNPVSLDVWGANDAGMRRWDRIVSVDGEVARSTLDVMERATAGIVPRPVTYVVEGLDGEVRTIQIPTRIFNPTDLIRSHAGQSLLGLVFVVIAVLLYILRPATPESWSFFAFFASLGVAMSSVVDLTFLWKLPPIYPYIGPFLGVFGLVLVGVVSGAYARSMRRLRSARMLRTLMWLLTGGGLSVSVVLSFGLYLTQDDIQRYLVFDSMMYSWLAFTSVVAVLTLIIAYRRSKAVRRRTRLRQILWAWPVGAGIPTLNLFVGHVMEMTGVSLLWNGFIVLVPISTADAIVRHDLLDLSNRARRLIGGFTVAALVGIGLGFAMWAAAEFLRLRDAAGMVALAALLFAIAAPLTHRVQLYVDQLLLSAPYDAGRLLADFSARASTAHHLREVSALLDETLRTSVRPEAFELYRLDRNERLLLPQSEYGHPTKVEPHLSELLERSEPALFDDEEAAPKELKRAWIALRLAVANEPVGLLTLSAPIDQSPYEAGDVAFVASLAGPLAAALVNTRSYEQVEALNQDLEKRVQSRTRELSEANEELARLNVRKDELVATISHDFRSPLAIIRQNVQTILRDLRMMEPEDLTHFLEGVARQESRLTSMCTNLLDLARLKENRTLSEAVDMSQLADQLLQGFEVRARQAGIRLWLEATPDAPVWVNGDPERLGQVLQNLLDNALKFTPDGGDVRVRMSRDADFPGPLLRMDIMDSGCGVPADALSRLFEPFFQVPLQTHVGQGSGLGLAIAKAVVDAHDGRIEVQSEEGKGTTFIIRLPGKTERAAQDAASKEAKS